MHKPILFKYWLLFQFIKYLTGVRETSCLRPGEYALPIHNDIKDTIDALNHFNLNVKNPA
jgi:hypothetical protein